MTYPQLQGAPPHHPSLPDTLLPPSVRRETNKPQFQMIKWGNLEMPIPFKHYFLVVVSGSQRRFATTLVLACSLALVVAMCGAVYKHHHLTLRTNRYSTAVSRSISYLKITRLLPPERMVGVVAFSSRARILGECSTIHSPPAHFFFFLRGD